MPNAYLAQSLLIFATLTPLAVGKAPVPGRATTPLDEYVAQEDPSFRWEVVERRTSAAGKVLLINLTSQRWRTDEEISQPLWKHWLKVVVPRDATGPVALLSVKGGEYSEKRPKTNDKRLMRFASLAQTVVAEVSNIPNQPLRILRGEDPRFNQVEDNLIAASWVRSIETDDPTWIAQLPMAKSIVASMDAVQQALADEEDAPTIEMFTVTGASKRGLACWLAAAIDDRVAAIAPLVIDLLNTEPSMRHHRASYGFYSGALGSYEKAGIADKLGSPKVLKLLATVDPYTYRERLTMPKCVINSAGDDYFLPDSSRFYYNDLLGEKHLCYTPNTGHGLEGSNAYDTLFAFHMSVARGIERPTISWTGDHSAPEHVVTCSAMPAEATLWRAVNPQARDFRKGQIGAAYRPTRIQPESGRSYRVVLESPPKGFSATFLRFAFDLGVGVPFRVSTPVWVTPDVEPFAEKD